MTVYGKGEQRKPFIALEDAVEGLARLAVSDPKSRPNDHIVYNFDRLSETGFTPKWTLREGVRELADQRRRPSEAI